MSTHDLQTSPDPKRRKADRAPVPEEGSAPRVVDEGEDEGRPYCEDVHDRYGELRECDWVERDEDRCLGDELEREDAVEEEYPQDLPPTASNTLTIWTCNVGGYYHIMDESGKPSTCFMLCLDKLQHPFVAFVNHLDLSPSDSRWVKFAQNLQMTRQVKVGRYRGNRHGVAVIHSDSICDFSYPPQDVGPEEA